MVKYDVNGTLQYTASLPSCFEVSVDVKGLFVGTDGVLYVAAEQDHNQPDNFHAAGYGPTGQFLWRYSLSHASPAIGIRSAVLNSKNELVMTGNVFSQFVTIQLATNHLAAWVYGIGDYNLGEHVGNALQLDAAENVYVTGLSPTSSTGNDLLIVKFNASGNQLWMQRYDGPAHGNDEGKAIAVDTQGSIYVAGYQTVPGGGTEMILIKYAALQNIALQTNGTANLQWFGKVGQNYRIQASTTLTNWTDLATVPANTNNIYSFQDTNVLTYPYRFYRSVSP